MEETKDNPMNTHVAFMADPIPGAMVHRIAAGTEEFCTRVLEDRLARVPYRTGYVRALTESELA